MGRLVRILATAVALLVVPSAAKNEGGKTTLLAAIFSRKCGLRPVARSGESSRCATA